MLVNIIAVLILFFSFVGGFTQGAVKSFFSLVSFLVALPIAGLFYPFFAGLLSFLPGENWENFVGFIIALAIASIIMSFIFYIPRKKIESIWHEGFFFRLFGGLLNLLSAAIGIVVFALVINAYPIADWLQQALTGSGVIVWLSATLSFVHELLPQEITALPDTLLLKPAFIGRAGLP